MASVEQAIVDKADWVEIDVQESSDGVVFVAHDEDLKKAAGFGSEDLEFDRRGIAGRGHWQQSLPEFADQRVPTLEQVLLACKGKVGVNIELKHYGHAQKLEERVIDLVAGTRHGRRRSDHVAQVRQRSESTRASARLDRRPTVGRGRRRSDECGRRLPGREYRVSPHALSSIPPRKRGKAVHVWTVNDPITMSTMIGRGAESLITDKPALAREVLRQRAELGSLERLLLELAILFGSPPPSSADDA